MLPWTGSLWLQLIKVEVLSLSLLKMAADGKSCSTPLPNDVAILYHNASSDPSHSPAWNLGPDWEFCWVFVIFFHFRERWDNPGLAC